MKEKVARGDKAILEIIEGSPRSVSMILDPTGKAMSEPLSDREGIVYAEIDTSRSVEPKQFHDLTGYYNRFDIFDLRVDRSVRDPARFREQSESSLATLSDTEAAHEHSPGTARTE